MDVTELVPGDVVGFDIGGWSCGYLLIQANGLEFDEAVLTGESGRSEGGRSPPRDRILPSEVFMGTSGLGTGCPGSASKTGPSIR